MKEQTDIGIPRCYLTRMCAEVLLTLSCRGTQGGL